MSRYYNDELSHYGMPRRSGRYKWGSGERPYQGDGPVGGIGVAHIGGKGNPHIAASAGALFQPNIATGKGKANVSAAERALNETNKGIESVKSTARQLHDTSKKNRPSSTQIKEVKNMTDDELRQYVNRKNLERQYYEAVKDPATNDGYNKIQNVLAVVGSVVSIAAGAATIYSSVKLAQQKKTGGDD